MTGRANYVAYNYFLTVAQCKDELAFIIDGCARYAHTVNSVRAICAVYTVSTVNSVCSVNAVLSVCTGSSVSTCNVSEIFNSTVRPGNDKVAVLVDF